MINSRFHAALELCIALPEGFVVDIDDRQGHSDLAYPRLVKLFQFSIL